MKLKKTKKMILIEKEQFFSNIHYHFVDIDQDIENTKIEFIDYKNKVWDVIFSKYSELASK